MNLRNPVDVKELISYLERKFTSGQTGTIREVFLVKEEGRAEVTFDKEAGTVQFKVINH